MRRLIIGSLALLFSINCYAQTKTSIANGNWNNPATWDLGVPLNGETVIIKHNVTITAAIGGFTFPSLKIDATGVLDCSTFGNSFSISAFANTGTGGNGKISFTQASGFINVPTISTNNFCNTAGSGMGTVEFICSAAGNFPSAFATFQHLIISGNASMTAISPPAINGDLTIGPSVILNVTNLSFTNTSVTQTISGGGTLNGTSTLNINKGIGVKLIDQDVSIIFNQVAWTQGLIELKGNSVLTIKGASPFSGNSTANYIQTSNNSYLVYQQSSALNYSTTFPVGNTTNGYTPVILSGTLSWITSGASILKLRSEPFTLVSNFAKNQLYFEPLNITFSSLSMQFTTGYIGSGSTVRVGCNNITPASITGSNFGTTSSPGSAATFTGYWRCYNPIAISSPPTQTVCEGSIASFSVTPSGGTGSQGYQWQKNATDIIGATTQNYSIPAAAITDGGNYSVNVTEGITNCVLSSSPGTLTVNPLPSVNAVGPQNVMTGTATSVPLVSSPPSASFAWTASLFSGTVTGFSNSSGSSIAQTLTGNGVVRYTVIPTLLGCPGSPYNIDVNVQLPVFYSRASGDWKDNTTWSITSFGGPAAPTPPITGAIVYIGNTDSVYFSGATPTIIIDSLRIDAGARLDVGTFGNKITMQRFESTGLGGNGKLKIAGSTYPTVVGANDFNSIPGAGFGTVEYYGGSYTLPTLLTYPRLAITGTGTKTLAANISVNKDLIVDGTSGAFHLGTFATSISVLGSTKVTSGNSIDFGTNTTKLFLNTGDFLCDGALIINSGTNTLELKGVNNNIASPSFNSTAFVRYNSSATQNIGVTNSTVYTNLELTGGGLKVLGRSTGVANNLNMNGAILQLSSYDLALYGAATTSGAFSSTNYIQINGGGSVNVNTPASPPLNKIIPMGSAGYFMPVAINLTSYTGSGSFIIRATDGAHPSVVGPNSLNGFWNIALTNSFSNISGSLDFTYQDPQVLPTSVDDNVYVTGYYNGSWSPGILTDVTEASNTAKFIFIGAATLDGGYAVGPLPAFLATTPSIALFSPSTACVGGTVTLSGTNFLGTTGITIGSTNVPVYSVANDNSITLTVPAGANTAYINVTNPAGTGTSSTQLLVIPAANIALTSSASTTNQTLCENVPITNIVYTITNATGAAATGLPAGVSGVYASGTFTISGTPTASGNFSYTVTVTGGCGSPTGTGSIDVKAVPLVNHVSPSAICSGSTTSITLTATIAGASFNWISSASVATGHSSASGLSINQNLNTTANDDVSYYVTAISSGCTGPEDTIVQTVNAIPVLITTNPAPVCFPATVNLTATAVTTGSSPGLSYSYWTNSGATISIASPSTVGASGTYFIKGTNAAACSTVTAVTATVNPIPSIIITDPASTCAPSTVDLTLPAVTAGSTAGLIYSYWVDAAATTPLTPATAVNTSGVYHIKGKDASNCFDIKPVNVVINLALNNTLSITPASDTLCAGESTLVTIVGTQNGVTYKAFNISTPVGNPVVGNGSNKSIDVLFSDLTAGANGISIVASMAGCPNVTLINTDTIYKSSIITPTISGNLPSLCNVTPIIFSVPNTFNKYEWYYSTTASFASSAIIVNALTNSETVYLPGYYFAKLYDIYGCSTITAPKNINYGTSIPVIAASASGTNSKLTCNTSTSYYQWYVENAAGKIKYIEGANSASFKTYFDGKFYVAIKYNDCYIYSAVKNISGMPGGNILKQGFFENDSSIVVPQIDYSEELDVFPNPSSGMFTVNYLSTSNETSAVTVYNHVGLAVARKISTDRGWISMEFTEFNLSPGVYFIEMVQEGAIIRKKMMIQ
jgi:hypothetical protein